MADDMVWLAGLFEGEGSIGGRGPNGSYLRMQIGMCDEDVVRRAHAVAGVGAVYGPIIRNPRHKPQWQWQTNRSEETLRLMLSMYPLFGARRRAKVEEVWARYMARAPRGGNHVKERCPRGHPYDIVKRRKGHLHRRCSICDNARQRQGPQDRTVCSNGHPLTPESTFLGRYGEKQCRRCRTGRPPIGGDGP